LRLFDASTPASATREERTSGLAAVLSVSDEATILRLFDEDRWRRLSVMERIAAMDLEDERRRRLSVLEHPVR